MFAIKTVQTNCDLIAQGHPDPTKLRGGQDRTGQYRTGQDRTGQDSSGQDRTGQDRTFFLDTKTISFIFTLQPL